MSETDKQTDPEILKRFHASESQWNDWHWQIAHRYRDAASLAKVFPLSAQEQNEIEQCLKSFRMAITPYYLSLVDPANPLDPIRRQCIPSVQETEYNEQDMQDPLNEDGCSPVPGIVHRYPDRVLFLVTLHCSMYCRHCTRRRLVGEEDRVLSASAMQKAFDYIRAHTEVRDVLISGGDPLTLSDERLEKIISSLRSIPHVDIIRIGTRVPAVMPMRITPELLNMLKKYHPIWINTHFNHPSELTPQAGRACQEIVDAGIPLGNQTVLLKGVNDTLPVMKELMLKLVHYRVRPYYIYQCDLSRGIGHFRTNVDTGIEIMHGLQGYISGFAVPKFVIDTPGGGGKVPVDYPYVLKKDDREVIMENYQGKICRYPQPKKR